MYEDLRNSAIINASKFDPSDYFSIGPSYFSCGFSKEAYYNNRYATALSVIGRIYGENLGQRSDYCKGIVYLSEKCGASRTQVKSLRKNFKSLGGYKCKVPFEICNIVSKLIELLEENRNNELVRKFLSSQTHTFYRNVLIEVHDAAISDRAKITKSEKIKQVRARLDDIMQTV